MKPQRWILWIQGPPVLAEFSVFTVLKEPAEDNYALSYVRADNQSIAVLFFAVLLQMKSNNGSPWYKMAKNGTGPGPGPGPGPIGACKIMCSWRKESVSD